MREKLATLPLTQLKELAKSQGIKNISGLRKAELIDRLCETAKAREQEAPAEAASVSGNAGAGSAETERPSAAPERTERQEHGVRRERTDRYERSDRQDRGERHIPLR